MTIQELEDCVSLLKQKLFELEEKFQKDLAELDMFKNTKCGFFATM